MGLETEVKGMQEKIKGIAVCNPVDVEKEYLLYTVDYAGKLGFNHIQVVGPIHNGVKGNIDGMTPFRKYSRFDNTKDMDYVQYSMDAINEACRKAKEYGIKMYQWHHELDLPDEFKEVYPEILNGYGDIEVTHPLVKDFLENKLKDFFYAYPGMDGIILTLHETKVPLLKLKDQKLGKVERVKYVTKILFDTCKALGKELIVRPFASIEEDYAMMTKAYEEIATELLIMDKWTQFDWSLTLPSNAFYHKIKNNPLLVEADIFGEYFGKGRLPIMLKKHIIEKVAYCDAFTPKGYMARIDRDGESPFGDVNEVNIHIMNACLEDKDVDSAIDDFFASKYGDASKDVRRLMEETEEVLTKTIYSKGYYFSELSFFPRLNHCKNHYYFEMMRENGCIDSNEWFVPRDWERGSLEDLFREKEDAVEKTAKLLEDLTALEGKIDAKEYHKLWVKFCSLKLTTEIWLTLMQVFRDYAGYFEYRDEAYITKFEADTDRLLAFNQKGLSLFGEAFYCRNFRDKTAKETNIETFVRDIRESFLLEKEAVERMEADSGILDYIVCGGAMEGHRLQKEVNFSDTLVKDGALCRIPGSLRGIHWCSVNAHGWFSYLIKVKPYAENVIKILMESFGEELAVGITVGEKEYTIREKSDRRKEYIISYKEEAGQSEVRICFDKISGHTPCIFTIKVEL